MGAANIVMTCENAGKCSWFLRDYIARWYEQMREEQQAGKKYYNLCDRAKSGSMWYIFLSAHMFSLS